MPRTATNGATYAGTCRECRKPLARGRKWGDCDRCKAERRRLAAGHAATRADGCEADDLGRAVRVAWYALVIEAGGRLFEATPTEE